MKIFSKAILMSSAGLLAVPSFLCLSFGSAYASLTNINQFQAFESRPQAAEYSKRPVSPLTKLAAVHFITNDGQLTFDDQEFNPSDLCLQNGYTFKGCPTNYIAKDPCPYDASYFKECINPSNWCKDNGYTITSCDIPAYLKDPCPNDKTLYKSCETDNIRACKELGYSLTCEDGKIGDPNQTCPYNSSYKKCICNPCTGYAYTASEATAQGYLMGESCNSCGTLKYKRTPNPCDGFLECTEGGASGASVCYSGSVKKFSECKVVCDAKFKYDSTNCTGGSKLSGASCGGKYEQCIAPLKYLYSDRTTSSDVISGKTIIGIVVDEAKRWAVALDYGFGEFWGPDDVDVPTLENIPWAGAGVFIPCGYDDKSKCPDANDTMYSVPDGKANTANILAYARSSGKSFPAFETVNKYKPAACSAGSWCGAGNWFIPSNRQVYPYFDNRDTILSMLSAIGKLPNDFWYTRKDLFVDTSNEISAEMGGFIYMCTGGVARSIKESSQNFYLYYIEY